ncbi:hypothetical protein [Rhizobium sp. ARZ01]|uniref:hypothetical protein n=1 Tax=Rhizobium sp. ARZ01 TaxID=2769313 RepID=UPI001FF03040|nr:hypothetical protein [Rhizobium sp. ARZ01]
MTVAQVFAKCRCACADGLNSDAGLFQSFESVFKQRHRLFPTEPVEDIILLIKLDNALLHAEAPFRMQDASVPAEQLTYAGMAIVHSKAKRPDLFVRSAFWPLFGASFRDPIWRKRMSVTSRGKLGSLLYVTMRQNEANHSI